MTLLASLSAVAPLLGVAVEQNQRDMAIRVLARICAHGKPWLVVFDNAESAEALCEWVEPLAGHGHVLITSRSENWGARAQPVSVTQWSEEESVRFLLARTGQRDRDVAAKLAEDLGWLALALEHAAAYMSAGDGMSMAEYRRVWKERLARTPAGDAYGRSVAASIGLSLDRVMEESPAGYELLSVLAWLAPDRIPKAELLEAGAAKLPEAVRAVLADRDAWNDLIELVGGRYSLLRRERLDGVVTGYYMHRVVQQVMRERLKADASSWLQAACDLVSRAFPFDSDEPPQWAAREALLPHARALRERVDAETAPDSVSRMLSQAGLYLRVRGLFVEARDFVQLALASNLRQFGTDHPDVAGNRSNLSNILWNLGEHQAAREQIELALASDLRQFGPDHPTIAVRRSTRAAILTDLGEHQAALTEIDQAREIFRKKLPPEHPYIRQTIETRESILERVASAKWSRICSPAATVIIE